METFDIPTLETERLRLRPFRASDIDDYAAMYADPEVVRYLGGGSQPWDRGRSWRHMAFLVGHWRLKGAGIWAIEQKETGTFVGTGGFAEPDGWPGFELAGCLASRWWRQGYAMEAGRAALDFAFTVLRKDHVISLVHPENRASIRVVEHLGQRLQRRIDHFGREFLLYGIDRSSFNRRNHLSGRHRIPQPPLRRELDEPGREL